MKSATVSKLKATLSEYLARVKAGEEVLVTERGIPIAKIIPLASMNSTTSLPTYWSLPGQGLFASAPVGSQGASGQCLDRRIPAEPL